MKNTVKTVLIFAFLLFPLSQLKAQQAEIGSLIARVDDLFEKFEKGDTVVAGQRILQTLMLYHLIAASGNNNIKKYKIFDEPEQESARHEGLLSLYIPLFEKKANSAFYIKSRALLMSLALLSDMIAESPELSAQATIARFRVRHAVDTFESLMDRYTVMFKRNNDRVIRVTETLEAFKDFSVEEIADRGFSNLELSNFVGVYKKILYLSKVRVRQEAAKREQLEKIEKEILDAISELGNIMEYLADPEEPRELIEARLLPDYSKPQVWRD